MTYDRDLLVPRHRPATLSYMAVKETLRLVSLSNLSLKLQIVQICFVTLGLDMALLVDRLLGASGRDGILSRLLFKWEFLSAWQLLSILVKRSYNIH